MPLGFLQLGSTHLKRSDWWRLKVAVCFFTIFTWLFAATIFAHSQYGPMSAMRVGSRFRTVTAVWVVLVVTCRRCFETSFKGAGLPKS